MRNILKQLDRHALAQPEKVALEDAACTMTYRQLARAITQVGARIAADRVAVMMDNGVPWAVVDLTIAACGAVSIPVPAFFSDEQVGHVLAEAAPDLLITDRPDYGVPLSRVLRHETIVIAHAQLHLYTVQPECRRTLPQDTGKIIYTSGTTRQPRGVCITRAAMDEVTEALASTAATRADDRRLTVLPLSTLLANIGGLYVPIIRGATAVLPSLPQCGSTGWGTAEHEAFMNALHRLAPGGTILTPDLLKIAVEFAQAGTSLPRTNTERVATAPMVPIRQGIYRILICRPNHRLGNTLLLTPLICELEERYQGAEIDIVSEGDIAADVFKGFFSVKRVFCLPRRGFKHPVTMLRTLFRMRRTRYDLIIDPALGSGFGRTLTRLLCARFKLGFSDRPTRALTHAAPPTIAGRHMGQRPVNLVRWAARSVPLTSQFYPPLTIHLSRDERAEGASVVAALATRSPRQKQGPVIGIFGNATGTKRYTEAWWMDFMATLHSAVPDASIIEILPGHARSMLREAWPGYYSSDIRRMAAVLAGLDLFVSADCGVMHLGAATGVPTIGLFKATVLDVYEPYGGRNSGLDTADASGTHVALRVIERFKVTRGSPILAKAAPRPMPAPAVPVHGAHIGG